MTEAEKLFSESHSRWLFSWSVLSNFRNIFMDVAQTVDVAVEERMTKLWKSLMSDPLYEGILITTDPSAKSIDPSIVKASSKVMATGAYGSLDAAVLVFIHSALDAAVFDLCRVTSLHSPADWENDVKNMTVSVVEAKSKPYDEILRDKLDQRLQRLEQEGLLAKIDRLFARCRPAANATVREGYEYEPDLIEAFDTQRHQIIHGNALGKKLALYPLTHDSTNYLFETHVFFSALVNRKYNLRIDPEYMGSLLQQQAR